MKRILSILFFLVAIESYAQKKDSVQLVPPNYFNQETVNKFLEKGVSFLEIKGIVYRFSWNGEQWVLRVASPKLAEMVKQKHLVVVYLPEKNL